MTVDETMEVPKAVEIDSIVNSEHFKSKFQECICNEFECTLNNKSPDPNCVFLHGSASNFTWYQAITATTKINDLPTKVDGKGMEYRYFAYSHLSFQITNFFHYLINQRALFVNLGLAMESQKKAKTFKAHSNRYTAHPVNLVNKKIIRNMLHVINLDKEIAYIDTLKTQELDIASKRTDFIGIRNMQFDEEFKRNILPQYTVIDLDSMLLLYKRIGFVTNPTKEDLKDVCRVHQVNPQEFTYLQCFFEGRKSAERYTDRDLRKGEYKVTPVKVSQPTKLEVPDILLSVKISEMNIKQWKEFEYIKHCDCSDFPNYFYNYKIHTLLVNKNKRELIDSKDVYFYFANPNWVFLRRHFLYNYNIRNITSGLLYYCLAVLYPYPTFVNIYEMELHFGKVFNIDISAAFPDYIEYLKQIKDKQVVFNRGYFKFHFSDAIEFKLPQYTKHLYLYLTKGANPERLLFLKNRLDSEQYWNGYCVLSMPDASYDAKPEEKDMRIFDKYLK